MKDRLLTVIFSVLTTIGVLRTSDLVQSQSAKELTVDRLIVRKELIVSDSGQPWEKGFEKQQIPRGIYAKSLGEGVAGLWVRSRLIKGEIDDPFDDRFHALERNGALRQAPGHLSWNVWLDDAWRQVAIVQGEGLEMSEVPAKEWSGGNHPGRLRFQSFRPNHPEPLTDALIGQGKVSIGGGGFGGGGLPLPNEVLELWGGKITSHALMPPELPQVMKHDSSGKHTYALIAVGPQGERSPTSKSVEAAGLATLRWDSVAGADAYVIVRDGKELPPVRLEGAAKEWNDRGE